MRQGLAEYGFHDLLGLRRPGLQPPCGVSRGPVEGSKTARRHQGRARKRLKLPPLPSSRRESHFVCQQTNSLKSHNLLKMETDHFNSPVTIKEIELVIKNFLEKKPPGPHCFIREFYRLLEEELTLSLPENTVIRSTSQFALWSSHYPDAKPRGRDYQKRKLQTSTWIETPSSLT